VVRAAAIHEIRLVGSGRYRLPLHHHRQLISGRHYRTGIDRLLGHEPPPETRRA